MTPFGSDRPRRKLPIVLVLVGVFVAALAGVGYYFGPRLERDAPQITLAPDAGVLGRAPMEIRVADPGSGLKAITVTLSAGGAEHTIASEQYADPVKEKTFALAASKLTGIKEGPATLRVTARDGSLWRFFGGNETVLQKELIIDITPPTVALIADDRYVTFGGVGAIVYKPSSDTVTSGVRIGEYFFPGFQGPVKNQPDHFIALFAHPYNVPTSTRAMLVATDKAGNTREMALVYELKGAKYRKSTIAVSESFIQGKVAPLLNDVA
ncbi:MAG TPA: hypothetical protein VFY80_07755, partial [Burkholderiales bacterium]|nr:hypothetical protein [Burkholderiales bacterium]